MRTGGGNLLVLAAALWPAVLDPQVARASFEKGGLLEMGPRAAALGGACAAMEQDAISARGAPAGLAYATSDYVKLAAGAVSQASLSGVALGWGSRIEDFGLAALVSRSSFTGGSEQTLGAGAGLPITELPWLALGAGIRGMYTKLGSDYAHAFGFDGSILARPPLPWRPLSLSLSVGVEDAFGELKWRGGLRDELPTMTHLAIAAGWLDALRFMAAVQHVESGLGGEDIIGAGLEYRVRLHGLPLALRSGIRDGEFRELSLCAGTGIRAGRYSFDYALVRMTESQGYLHIFSAGAALGRNFLLQDAVSRTVASGRIRPGTSVVRVLSPYRTLRFFIDCPRRGHGVISAWTAVVMDAEGKAVWSAEGEGRPPAGIVWNFTTEEGEFAPAGEYSVQLLLSGPESFRFISRPVRFRLERPSPPPVPGQTRETSLGRM